jgi:hypothetical protein
LILLLAILMGMAAGLLLARLQKRPWTLPPLRGVWLVIIGFMPQFIAFYLPSTRAQLPTLWVSVSLLSSQILLLLFCWLNRRLSGTWLLALGLTLNLVVIAANGGLMPLSPHTLSRLAPPEVVDSIPLGSRVGNSKDILLMPADTHFEWLSDRFLLPEGSPYQAAFSLGDVVIALGAFWLITSQGKPLRIKGSFLKEAECYRQERTNPPSL